MPRSIIFAALIVDMLAVSFVLGATIWFFFIQAPVLLKRMGRERFVPLQMRLAVVYFNVVAVAVTAVTAGAAVRARTPWDWSLLAAAFALLAVCINKFIVLPRALRAGGQSLKQHQGSDKSTVADFASEGAGPSTALLHRLVVLFVVLMVAGLLAHSADFVTASLMR